MEPPSSQSADPRHSRADVVDGAIDAAQARDDQIEIAETPPHPAAAELAEEEEEEDGSEFLERARSYEEAADERAYEPEEQIDVSRYSLPLQTADDKPDGFRFSWRRFCLFVGPGFLMSIAYLDPGNLESDLQAGAQTGYSLLWILFWSTALGLLLQAIAARVGVVTGCHLAELCRMEYSPVVRTVLWLMAEVAIVGADIQEVIGCAIAIRILTQGAVPLWAGVLITGLDSFLLLFLENLGIRKLEALFGLFISIMAVSFARMFLEAAPDTGAIAQGLLIPSIPRGAMGMAVSIVGAVIMPHNIFLHSALVQSRAIDRHSPARVSEALVYFTLESAIALLLSFLVNLCVVSVFAKLFYGRPGAVDIGLDNAAEYLQEAFGSSTFPVVFIWAAGLLAAGQSSTMTGTYAGQFVMSGFLDLHVCKWEAFGSSTFPVVFIWAAGLLAAGQSSTMTGTYAGQFVMSGFLDLHVCKWVRVLVTRMVTHALTLSCASLSPLALLFAHLLSQEAFGSSTFPVVFIWAAGLLAAGQSSTMTGTYAGQFVMSGFLDLHVCKWEAFGSSTFPVVFIWAAGLLAAGQSSTMTGTYAGQFVMSGFLDLHVRKWVRVLVTRTVAIVPTIVVALLYSSPAASPPVAALFVPLTGAADTSAAAAAVPTFVNVSTPFRPATATAAASLLFSSPLAALPSPITDHSLVSSISPSNASLQFITSLAASLPFSSTPHSSSYPLSSPPPLSLPHSPLMPLSPPPCSPSPRWIPSTSGSTSSSPCSCPSPSSPFLLSPRHRTSWGDTQSRGRSRC
ncbi:hypothetical protein CLOM_g4926 [Closterium sp. NIES-68]|nr:hypothetical protein CLOM_g4926 [Closterium sp. NIES-68]